MVICNALDTGNAAVLGQLCNSMVVDGISMLLQECLTNSIIALGMQQLCQHNFEHNRYEDILR